MSWYKNIINFINQQWGPISYFILFIVFFTFFLLILSIPTFPDPDSFYHIKQSQLIVEQGVITSFPWLQFTILKDSFIDQHFLYHVFLIPFVTLLDPIQGVKLAHVFLSTGFMMLFYWFLRKHNIKFAFIFTLILLVSTPFVFRLALVKAPVASLIFLLLGLYCLFRYKYLTLFFVSFAYVWTYGGFILILIASGVYALVSVFKDWLRPHQEQFFNIVARHSRELKLFFISVFGTMAGIFINPQFPENIKFYWHQLVQIGIVNYQNIIPVGNEWYPYKVDDLAIGSAIVTLLVLVSLILLIIKPKPLTKKLITFFILFIFFLAFTLKSRRYVEYYIPFAILFSAFTMHQYLGDISWSKIRKEVATFFTRFRVVAIILIVYFVISLSVIVVKDMRQLFNDYEQGIPTNRFSGAATWIRENSQPGDIVFHSSWDEFPILFYYNSYNYYIAGLDPTFTYQYDKEIYRIMVDITTGQQQTNVYEDIRDKFNASFVFIEASHEGMEKAINGTPGFKEVYRDEEAIVYEVFKGFNK